MRNITDIHNGKILYDYVYLTGARGEEVSAVFGISRYKVYKLIKTYSNITLQQIRSQRAYTINQMKKRFV